MEGGATCPKFKTSGALHLQYSVFTTIVREYIQHNVGKHFATIEPTYDAQINAFLAKKGHSRNDIEFYEITHLLSKEFNKAGLNHHIIENKDTSTPIGGWYIRDKRDYIQEEFGDLSIDHNDVVVFPEMRSVLGSHLNELYC
jgi:hypothetical protein